MADKKTLTFALMDGPFENARTVSALRMIDIACQRGYDVTVFAFEGVVSLTFAKQAPHANAVHGRDVEEEDHPLPKDWVAGLMKLAESKGGKLNWINCGLCLDERGTNEAIAGTQRGAPKHLWEAANASDGSLILGAR